MTDQSLPDPTTNQADLAAISAQLLAMASAVYEEVNARAPQVPPTPLDVDLLYQLHRQLTATHDLVHIILRTRRPEPVPVMSEEQADDVEPGWVCSYVTGDAFNQEDTDNCDQDARYVDGDGKRWCADHVPDDEFVQIWEFTDPREIDETR